MWVWVLFFLSLVLAGLVLRIWRQYKSDKETKEVLRRFSNVGLSMGILGLFWMFLRQERVPFLAWRFWLWFWLLIFVWWLSDVVRYIVTRLPQIKKEKAEREQREKYLPNKK